MRNNKGLGVSIGKSVYLNIDLTDYLMAFARWIVRFLFAPKAGEASGTGQAAPELNKRVTAAPQDKSRI